MRESVRERPAPERMPGLDAETTALAVHKRLDDLLSRIRDALGVDTVAVLLLNEEGTALVPRAAKGLEEELERGVPVPLGKGFAGRVAAEARPIVIEDVDQAEIVNVIIREKGIKSLLGVPLAVEGLTLGVLHVGTLTPRTFTDEDIRWLELIAERVALPLAQSQLVEVEQDARSVMDAARVELEFLAEASALLSSSLDYETTLASVAELAVPRLADWCVIDLVEEGTGVRRVAVVCADEDKKPLAEELRRSYPSHPQREEGTSKVLRTGRSEHAVVTAEWLDAMAPNERQREILGRLGLQSNLLVPLVARGRTLGVLTLATAQSGRIYRERDVRLAEELASRAALAVDNARLYRDEKAAAERLSFLAEASVILGSSLDYEQTLRTVADLVVPSVADWCMVYIVDEDGELRRLALAHTDPAKVAWAEELGRRYPDDPDSPRGVHHVFRTRETELVPEVPDELLQEVARDEEHVELLRKVGVRSYVCVPLVARDRALGVLTLLTVESNRSYGQADLEFAQELARRAALAVDNAGLLREALEKQEQLRFLAEAGALLASSLDYRGTLQRVAQLAVPAFADWCIVDVVEGGQIQRVAVAASDAESQQLLEELRERYPPSSDSPQPAAQALRAGKAVIFHEFTAESLAKTVKDDRHLEIIERLAPRSALAVPLVARDHTVGAITLAWSRTGRLYEERDVPLAEELARRAALAVDNARLYREADERAQAALALERVGDGVFLVDGEGVVRLWNPAAEAITGLRREDVLGRRIDDAVPGWGEVGSFIPVAEAPPAAAKAEAVPLEVGGRELWLSVSAVALEEGTVYAFRDLTEERGLERIRSDFVSTVSHELRTPLASVYGAAVTLARKDMQLDDEKKRKLLDVVAAESERLARMVDDVLLASRLDSESVVFAIESCDPVAALDAAVTAAETHLPDGVAIRKVPSSAPRVVADREQLRQILENLIDNALKYGPSKGAVEVGVGQRGRWACFWVRDEGPGVPERERERIFEKFYRLDAELLSGVRGTGLGLYISRELVEKMGGRIWVESGDGEGSTFFFELPLA